MGISAGRPSRACSWGTGCMTRLDHMSILLLDFFLAFRNSVRHGRRTAIAVGAVAFGIAALIVASGFVEWMLLTFREEAIQSRLGHLQIVRPGYHTGGSAD